MKRLVLAMTLLMVSTLSFAQITKGDIQLGGTMAFSKIESPGFERSNFTLAPRAGLFVSDLTSIGVQLQYTAFETNGLNSNLLEFGVYSRFHKMISENLYLFLQPSLSIGTGSDENDTNTDTDISSFDIRVAPGMTYFVSSKIALEMNLGALFYKTTTRDQPSGKVTSDNYGLNLNLNTITLGFSYYIK